LLSACSTTPYQAPVVDRTTPSAAPAVKPAAPSDDAQKDRDERGLYTVKKGDTLIRIALEYGQNYRDLVTWNNLSNPNDIKVDQVLRVLPPEAVNGVQTAAVVTPSTTEVKAAPVLKKTGPRGEKKPYSESALAELQKPESADNGGGRSEPQRPERPAVVAAATAAPAPVVPPAAQLSAEDRELSWAWPSEGRVIANFDEGKNKGIDIAGKAGQQVLAAGAGKVMYAGSGIRGYGNLVIVKHSNSLLSAYGQMIAEMGDSDTDAVKLHFEIRQQGKPVDPSKFLPNR
jgi:lipoprotein NlpD